MLDPAYHQTETTVRSAGYGNAYHGQQKSRPSTLYGSNGECLCRKLEALLFYVRLLARIELQTGTQTYIITQRLAGGSETLLALTLSDVKTEAILGRLYLKVKKIQRQRYEPFIQSGRATAKKKSRWKSEKPASPPGTPEPALILPAIRNHPAVADLFEGEMNAVMRPYGTAVRHNRGGLTALPSGRVA
jgi:hypothetical protein